MINCLYNWENKKKEIEKELLFGKVSDEVFLFLFCFCYRL